MNGAERFFDTNVILYLVSADRKKAEIAEHLIAGGGVVSVQVLNEFADVASRKAGSPWSDIRETLTAVQASCRVEPISLAIHDRALEIAERYRFRIYDSLIVAAALQAKCTELYSEDFQSGQTIGGLAIRNPFAVR
jgi:predicted nucleic acid-binding protein